MNVNPALVALAIESRMPRIDPARAAHFAHAIVATHPTPEEAAALVINLERESRGIYDVETCETPGIGGWGAWGVSLLMGGCGPVGTQAKASRAVWLDAWHRTGGDALRSFRMYIGARAREDHPEARIRVRGWYAVREMFECECSVEE